MSVREASLRLQLVDGVSGPARAIERSLSMVNKAVRGVTGGAMAVGRGVMNPGRAVVEGGRAMRSTAASSAGISAPVGLGAYAAARNVYDYEKQGNTMEAVGQLTEAQREQLEQYGKELNKNFPFINKQILEAASELGKSGMDFDQIMGSLRSTLETALAGDIDLGQSADIMTNIAQAMRLPVETVDEAAETMARISDTLAYAATNSNSSIEEMAVVFRYVAPLAAATGMSLEELAVASMNMANNGIKASNAGTGLRFALTRMLNMPKAGLAALERLNINLGDFIKGAKAIDAEGIVSMLQIDGIDASGLERQIQEVLNDPAIAKSPAKLVKALSRMLTEELGDQGVVDGKALSDSLAQILTVLGTEVDLQGFLKAIGDRPEGEALMAQIFGSRHAAKLLGLMAMDVDGALAEFESKYKGAAKRMSEIRIKGVVGDVLRMAAALDNLTLTLSDSGVLESARKAIVGITEAIDALGQSNPKLLEWGTYAALGLAAIAPLAWGVAGLAGALGLVINPLTWVAAGLGYLAYLNMDSIVSYLKGFGDAVAENMGPHTQGMIERAKTLLSDLFQTHDVDAAGAGQRHGSWFAQALENEIIGIEKAIEETKNDFDRWGRFYDKSISGLQRGWSQFEGWWDGLVADVNAGLDRYIAASVAGISRAATEISAGATALYNAGVEMVQSLWDGATAKFNEFIGWVKGIPGRIRAAIGSIDLSGIIRFPGGGNGIAERAAAANAGGGGTGQRMVDGMRARGGPVNRGLTYLVGERGPELFTPNRTGNIVPNHKIGGGGGGSVTFNNHFHLNGKPSDDLKQAMQQLERQLTRSAEILVGGAQIYGDL